MRNLASLKDEVDEWTSLHERAMTSQELVSLAIEERDDSFLDSIAGEAHEITQTLDSLEFKLLFSGEYDRRNAILAIHAGAGGVDSQDWAQILMRMYIRWAESRGMKPEVLDVAQGEEAGVKSVTIQISGDYAYGYLRSERGVHRLVRISPFDADHARHTSFALAEVLPEVERGFDVEIDEKELKMENFKAGGAGGQSVQKNSTAVRITHVPTGIKVSCQNERSLHQNKAVAMKILAARLMEREMKERAKEISELKGDHISAEWGNQIRSYVIHPYKMVKDHRTNYEVASVEKVLDGDVDSFMDAYLRSTVGPIQN